MHPRNLNPLSLSSLSKHLYTLVELTQGSKQRKQTDRQTQIDIWTNGQMDIWTDGAVDR